MQSQGKEGRQAVCGDVEEDWKQEGQAKRENLTVVRAGRRLCVPLPKSIHLGFLSSNPNLYTLLKFSQGQKFHPSDFVSLACEYLTWSRHLLLHQSQARWSPCAVHLRQNKQGLCSLLHSQGEILRTKGVTRAQASCLKRLSDPTLGLESKARTGSAVTRQKIYFLPAHKPLPLALRLRASHSEHQTDGQMLSCLSSFLDQTDE